MAYSKKELRQAYIARLQQLDLNTRLYEERKLASLLYDQPEWTGAKTIAVTLSQSFEIDNLLSFMRVIRANRLLFHGRCPIVKWNLLN